ncbi:TetR family transcriptional regulator [Leptobacterium flavescens]|uniref:TetR family transcriptional regulator n=1 Tax=Leptobacterium flavescens TaxID=472055 RepID=A0A6P0UTI7_9FLAO|nr:TetR/AcrR family transcriptional regulator [Leptobacterium flavescens]NER13736.1 TetR family transcriptional regulator [Leptobacterium flavescens]
MGYKYQKKDILKIGYDTIRKNGYHNVGINTILQNANIPKGSFYNFFASKEDFAQQVLQFYGENSGKFISEMLSDKRHSPYNRLKNLYRELISQNEEDQYASGCILNNMANEIGGLNKPLSTVIDKIFMNWMYLLADCIKEGQLLGEIRDDHSALELAEYIHTGIYGAYSRMKMTHDRLYLDNWFKMTFEFISS